MTGQTEVMMDVLRLAKLRQFKTGEDSQTAHAWACAQYRIKRLQETKSLLASIIKDPVLNDDDDIAEDELINELDDADPYSGGYGMAL